VKAVLSDEDISEEGEGIVEECSECPIALSHFWIALWFLRMSL